MPEVSCLFHCAPVLQATQLDPATKWPAKVRTLYFKKMRQLLLMTEIGAFWATCVRVVEPTTVE
jgi:hypothetical protein